MGIPTIGARKKVLLAASELHESPAGAAVRLQQQAAAPALAPLWGQQLQQQRSVARERGSGVGDWRALARGEPSMLVGLAGGAWEPG